MQRRKSFMPSDLKRQETIAKVYDDELSEWSEKDKEILKGLVAMMKGTKLHEIEENYLNKWAEKNEPKEDLDLIDFEEGIFIFTNTYSRCFNMPVDE